MILVIHRSFNYATRSKQCLCQVSRRWRAFFPPAQCDSETFITVKLKVKRFHDGLISALKMQPVIWGVCHIRPLKLFLAATRRVIFPFREQESRQGVWGLGVGCIKLKREDTWFRWRSPMKPVDWWCTVSNFLPAISIARGLILAHIWNDWCPPWINETNKYFNKERGISQSQRGHRPWRRNASCSNLSFAFLYLAEHTDVHTYTAHCYFIPGTESGAVESMCACLTLHFPSLESKQRVND